jgi:tRNA pseudouridine55 synthase
MSEIAYNGWLIINKPVGMSSAHVVAKVKRLVGRNNKVGHAGTLDPLAQGVLPIAIGEATKVTQFLLDSSKEYEFDVTWGEERSTDDAEGEVVRKSDLRFQIDDLKLALEKFKGEIEQVPPQYSAIKVEGQRAYDVARDGGSLELKARRVTVHRLELTSEIINPISTFQLECSKGTYVRSIARDMGRELGCFGYVSRLLRTRHGQFALSDAITLENFEEICKTAEVSKALLPLEKVLDGIPALSLDDFLEAKIRNGVGLDISVDSEITALKKNEKLVAIASPKNGKLHPVRVFNH